MDCLALSAVLTCFFEVLVCAMYLRVRRGGVATLNEVGEVAHYRGFFGYIWTLFVRYMAWIMIVFVALAAVAVVMLSVSSVGSMASQKTSGVGEVAGGSHSLYVLIGLLLGLAISVAMISRYSLAMPMFAIVRGDKPRLWYEGVRLARSIWSTLAAISLVATIPVAVEITIDHYARGHFASSPLLTAGSLLLAFVDGVWATWFVLLRLEISLQVIPKIEPPASTEPGLRLKPAGDLAT